MSAQSSLSDFALYRDRKFVVILAIGRSGSTLLQGLLNAMPGHLVRGENFSFLQGLYRSYISLQRAKRFAAAEKSSDSWFGAAELDQDRFAADLAPVIARQLIGGDANHPFTALGFKEIRWTELNGPHEHLWGFLQFIEAVFPLAHFILLTRNIDEIMKSGWWAHATHESTRLAIEGFFTMARVSKVKRLFELDYADLRPSGDRLRELCDYLGERYTPELEAVFRIKHGF